MGSNQSDVEVSYGVGNDFFKLWLDPQMHYTCALFKDEKDFSDDLASAQNNKVRRLSDFAGIDQGVESVLDIGCGWGANLAYQVYENKVPRVHGITLSREQYHYCLSRDLPRTAISCKNFWDYKRPFLFDSAMCICMMEHLVSPQEARAGLAVSIYRKFFKKVHALIRPNTRMGLQCITRQRVPRENKDLSDLRHATYVIFPNAVVPRMENIVMAVNPYFEVQEMHEMRLHYKKTTWHWRKNLRKNESFIREKWGDRVYSDYDRYLSTCVTGFENNWLSVHQFSLKRLDV